MQSYGKVRKSVKRISETLCSNKKLKRDDRIAL